MNTKLVQLQNRVKELESLAQDVFILADGVRAGQKRQPELQIKGQQWYRGTRELLSQQDFSGLKEFDDLFFGRIEIQGRPETKGMTIDRYIGLDPSPEAATDFANFFAKPFEKCRSLLLALEAQLRSRELPILTQLSFAIVADEFDTAEALLSQYGSSEALLRAAGVVARVALERHLFCVADLRSVQIIVNPPTKRKPDVEDVLGTLIKANVITPVQKAHFDSLFKIANNCAHPKEPVRDTDVSRLIRDGRTAAAAVQ
jgi:hypothetical protein